MERKEIYEKLNEIFCDVLDLEDVKLTDDMSSDDFVEWNSLAHVQLVFEIETCFNLKFSAKEVLLWENIGEMVDVIQERVK